MNDLLLELARLEAIAKDATQGKWMECFMLGTLEGPDGFKRRIMAHGPLHLATDKGVHLVGKDMEHIAAFSPEPMLRLIERIRNEFESC